MRMVSEQTSAWLHNDNHKHQMKRDIEFKPDPLFVDVAEDTVTIPACSGERIERRSLRAGVQLLVPS